MFCESGDQGAPLPSTSAAYPEVGGGTPTSGVAKCVSSVDVVKGRRAGLAPGPGLSWGCKAGGPFLINRELTVVLSCMSVLYLSGGVHEALGPRVPLLRVPSGELTCVSKLKSHPTSLWCLP